LDTLWGGVNPQVIVITYCYMTVTWPWFINCETI